MFINVNKKYALLKQKKKNTFFYCQLLFQVIFIGILNKQVGL